MFGSLVWSLINAAATIFTPFILFTILARTAEAWQVGAIGVAISLLELLKTFAPQGLYEVLLRRNVTENQKSAALGFLLTFGTIGSALYCGLVVLVSNYISDFERILPSLLLLAPKLFFDLAALQPQAEAARMQLLRRLALRTVFANGLAATTGAVLAATGNPLFGLVMYYIIQSGFGFLLVYLGPSKLVIPSLKAASLAGLIQEIGYASGVRLIAAGNNYADTLIVAAFVGPTAIGFYNLAKRLETALMNIASSFGTMLFQPSYAKGSVEQRANTMNISIKITTLLFGIPVVVFACFSHIWVGWVFGVKWIDAGPTCALLAISGLMRTYGTIHGSLLSVSGSNRTLLYNSLFSFAAGTCIVASLAQIGIGWVALGLAVKNFLFTANLARLSVHDPKALLRIYIRQAFIPLSVTIGIAGLTLASTTSFERAYGKTLWLGASTSICLIMVSFQVLLLYGKPLKLLLKRFLIRR